jgi:type I protein arginine methyltransferase
LSQPNTRGSLTERVRDRLRQNERLRGLVYAVRNRKLFADLGQHDRMLADSVRVDIYQAAIAKHVGPDDVVLDLGTGSGVLAFFASRAGAKRVHAVEHGPMIEAAQAVAADNGIDNVEFHREHSRSLEVPGGVDVILHEQIGEALFDERVIENVVDLRDRLLKPGGRILPAHLRLFIEPVQVPSHSRIPFAWQQELHGISFKALEALRDAQPPGYWQPRSRSFPFEAFVGRPEPVVAVDLHEVTLADVPTSVSYSRTALADCSVDGLCVYFEAAFDNEHGFGSSPADPPTHWGSPLLRIPIRDVKAGQIVDVSLALPDIGNPRSWTWKVDIRDA